MRAQLAGRGRTAAGVHSNRMRRYALSALAVLLSAAAASGSELSDDLTARRGRMMDRLGADAMTVLFSAPVRNYSHDVSYEYRQDSNFYYLTGLTQSDSILVLMPGNATRRESLFVSERNAEREHWNGRLLSVREASESTGIQTVMGRNQFEPFIAAMLNRRGFGPVDDKDASQFFEALGSGRARVGL